MCHWLALSLIFPRITHDDPLRSSCTRDRADIDVGKCYFYLKPLSIHVGLLVENISNKYSHSNHRLVSTYISWFCYNSNAYASLCMSTFRIRSRWSSCLGACHCNVILMVPSPYSCCNWPSKFNPHFNFQYYYCLWCFSFLLGRCSFKFTVLKR